MSELNLVKLTTDMLSEYCLHRNRMLEYNKNEPTGYFSPIEKTYDSSEHQELTKKRISGSKPEAYIWVILDSENKIRGACDLETNSLPALSHRINLGMGMEKSVQSKGMGSKLMSLLVSEAKKLGFDYIDLGVFENNFRAKKLYEKFGFKQTAYNEDYFRIYGKSVGHFYMTLKLES